METTGLEDVVAKATDRIKEYVQLNKEELAVAIAKEKHARSSDRNIHLDLSFARK